MTFDLSSIWKQYEEKGFDLFAEHVNPQLARVLKTIGFNRSYVRAEGPYLYDQDDNEYLDFLSGYGVFGLGRNHPKIKTALKDAIDFNLPNMIQMDAPQLAGLLAERLLKAVGGKVDTVFFTNSGTESNEGALKFARRKTGRPRILYLEHAFHGLTTGSLAVNGNDEFRKGFGDLLPGTTPIPSNDIERLRSELMKGDVAAFIIELVQGKGVFPVDDRFAIEAQALCRAYGALFIIDEIQTGLGRTGKLFAHHHYGLEPDIVTVAKALSGGFIPVGAICYTRDVYESVFRNMSECVIHSNTFGRNALAMVAGLATLDTLEEEGLVDNAARIGEKIIGSLRELLPRFEMMSDVRGKGLMIAIEFSEPKTLGLKTGWKLIHAANKGLFGQMVVVPLFRDHRILTQVAGHNMDVVKILPPLVIGPEHATQFVRAFEEVMFECHRFPGSAWSVGKDLATAALRA